ncbi:PEP/pyruvate-binding domain-containing protein [Saccharopolyspora mangrovi]|uniref:PEP/pyruvate-binding domain-containing protein n=1 Tax=Saccharopolyspora mangrovi TaxID=3082379 RepID=A0ABU6AD79_9PSEU|nr:PEP/pyruvate-binding domain-containing protein [Saccharopolyspora sp. S2-29]MEB3369406.1 PEP/pyruvate-binding domain-containing protein [Saccharopolyspora sp. S2-29]
MPVLRLEKVNARMGEVVGGKAANLGELLAAGFRVPPGFVITTDAYEDVCRVTDLLDGLPNSAPEIRERIRTTALPPELITAITAGHEELGAGPVAVRSSATAEDLPHASFAGQQDTYLNVVGPEALLDAVRRCWASLWTDRAVAYREANGVEHSAVRLAVVVQRMVDARTAGVLFTANPVTGDRSESVIDANTGLGESVVSGSVTPDHFVVSGNRVTARLGDKPTSIRSAAAGGVETVAQDSEVASIDDEQARELAELGRDVARHFGAPQDVEWAIGADGVWLTQSRPITTLFPLPAEAEAGLRMYVSINVAQGVYRPLTPMGVATLGLLASGVLRELGLPAPGVRPEPFRSAGGWVFLDITRTARNRIGRAVVPRLMAAGEARTGRVYESLLADPRFALEPGVPWRLWRALGRFLARNRIPLLLAGVLRDPARARDEAFRRVEELRSDLAAPEPATARERLETARHALLRATAPRMAWVAPRMMPILLLGRLLPKLTRATESEIHVVLSGIPHNVTTEMDLELWSIAQHIGPDVDDLAARYRDRSLPAEVLCGLDEFLQRHGHRTAAEIDVGVPRWSEDPDHVLGLVENYARTGGAGHDAAQRFRECADEAEVMASEIVSRLPNRVHARIAAFLLDRVRGLAGLRELPKYCAILGIASTRRHLRRIGDELSSSRRISDPADVFFLDFDELSDVIDGNDHRDLIAARRETHKRELRRKHLPRLLLSDGTEPETQLAVEETGDGLRGTSASAGTVTGVARVIRDPVDAHLNPGEILVAPSTDPGWTPLFLTASGLVMEMGGPNSHGATVAREYGIPAVVGVTDATTRITDGQTITIHGSTGTVEL